MRKLFRYPEVHLKQARLTSTYHVYKYEMWISDSRWKTYLAMLWFYEDVKKWLDEWNIITGVVFTNCPKDGENI